MRGEMRTRMTLTTKEYNVNKVGRTLLPVGGSYLTLVQLAPVRTTSELANLVQKISDYTNKSYALTSVFAADKLDSSTGYSFKNDAELLIDQENKKLDDEIIREEEKEAPTIDDTISSKKEIPSDAPSDIPKKTTPDLKNIRNKIAKPKKNDE